MNGYELVVRVRILADDANRDADLLFGKARRMRTGAMSVQGEAKGKRENAAFLNSLADAIEASPDAAVKALVRRL